MILKQCITLAPQHEHLVWGKLKEQVPLSIRSTIVVKPKTSKSSPRNVLVAHTVCPLWGDKWIPMKVVNLLNHQRTKKDTYPLPNQSDALAALVAIAILAQWTLHLGSIIYLYMKLIANIQRVLHL